MKSTKRIINQINMVQDEASDVLVLGKRDNLRQLRSGMFEIGDKIEGDVRRFGLEKNELEQPCTPEDKIIPTSYGNESSTSVINIPSRSIEDKSKSEEESEFDESESDESDVMYDIDKKERKSGPFKLSDGDRTEIESVYAKLKKDVMWRLSSRRFVEEELYSLGKKLEFEHTAHSFIIDTDDEIIKQHFTELELEEIDNASVPEVPDLAQDIIEYLNKFINIDSAKKVRSIISEQDDRFNINYDSSIHHDLDYIRFALYALTREIENGGLVHPNLESWYNCHIWNTIVDQGFADIKGTLVVRGESTCIATATRKNRKRVVTQRRKMGRRGDWILRLTGNGDRDEYGIGEVGKCWLDRFGTKFLGETSLKQPKALKDMLVKLMKRINWDKELCSKVQTVGITHSGLMMTVMHMDNPHGYVCRIRRGEFLEVPDKEENLSALLVILAAILNIKIAVRETIKVVQPKMQSESIFKQAGRLKRPRNSDEIPACFTTPKKFKEITSRKVGKY
ncbi:hypothetical protein G9A89_002176 [Geosiphon pyriformis]|nr:hypothetical protein G9A89_002176 [Geosiphon pyriformis]